MSEDEEEEEEACWLMNMRWKREGMYFLARSKERAGMDRVDEEKEEPFAVEI
jgi:hypothetical protein